MTMLVLQRLPARFSARCRGRDLLTLATSALVGGGVTTLTWTLAARRDKSDLMKELPERTKEFAPSGNAVSAILVEFRGFDIPGELSVLVMTAVAIPTPLSTVRGCYIGPSGDDPYLTPVTMLQINQGLRSRARRAIMET